MAVLLLLGAADGDASNVRLAAHEGLKAFARMEEPPVSYRALEQQAQAFADQLGLTDDRGGSPAWARLLSARRSPHALYETVQALGDEDLEQLHLLLTVLCFGQGDCHRLDTGDTLFNRVARDIGVDMRAYWQPDEDFLSRRTRAQLTEIAVESGLASRLGHPSAMKKSELVKTLARHFARVRTLEEPTEADLQARDWLPEAMRFPAVDPAAEEVPAEADDGEFDDEALAA